LFQVPPTAFPMIEDDPNIVIGEVPSGTHHVFAMHCEEEPFTDVRVRQAIKLIVDREELVHTVLQGHGEPAADHPIPPHDPMFAGLPVPKGATFSVGRGVRDAKNFAERIGYPVVVKPAMGDNAIETFRMLRRYENPRK
jgi:ABC-type transport system substrate-binding protein